MKVLIVEDNGKSMKLIRDGLLARGYRTLEAATGRQALELAVEHEPDLVLMDIQLPDLDRPRVLESAASGRASCLGIVLAVTAQAMHGDHERFLAAGFDGYPPSRSTCWSFSPPCTDAAPDAPSPTERGTQVCTRPPSQVTTREPAEM